MPPGPGPGGEAPSEYEAQLHACLRDMLNPAPPPPAGNGGELSHPSRTGAFLQPNFVRSVCCCLCALTIFKIHLTRKFRNFPLLFYLSFFLKWEVRRRSLNIKIAVIFLDQIE